MQYMYLYMQYIFTYYILFRIDYQSSENIIVAHGLLFVVC